MKPNEIASLYEKGLNQLLTELESYPSEEIIWKTKEGIGNSAGNLGLHLAGSINHFIGATLGSTGYIRDRDKEFLQGRISREELIEKIRHTKSMAIDAILKLTVNDLEKEFKFDLAGKHSTEYYLIFFAMHMNYHLGQINYHRRLLSHI